VIIKGTVPVNLLIWGVVFVCVALAATFDCVADEGYYYAGGKRIGVEKSPGRFVVRFAKGVPENSISSAALLHNLEGVSWPAGLNQPDEWRIFELPAQASSVAVERVRTAFEKRVDVEATAPVYRMKKGEIPVFFFDEIVIKFHDETTGDEIKDLLDGWDLEFVRRNDYVAGQVICRVPKSSGRDALEAANLCYEAAETSWAHPNFVSLITRQALVDDPLFSDQWHLHNTGQSGSTVDADVDIVEAWDITMGEASIIVSIQDDSVENDHEDLAPNYVTGWNFLRNKADPGPIGVEKSHGTSVAGVAVGRGNNGIGISGAAPMCGLIGIRWGPLVSDTADMFYWSDNNGAAVINNSWSFVSGVVPDAVRDAIDYVAANGRGGKGCVVLFASGNEGTSIISTSTAAMSSVIAVGASTNFDVRSYYSNYGPQLDVVAPSNGGSLGITTTDRTGSKGYSSGNYTDSFGGTSSATPLTAGVCALILSVEPELTGAQVQSILEHMADKIGPNAYVGGRNDFYGYGRVNAFSALTALGPEIDYIGQLPDGSISISWNSVPGLNYKVFSTDDLMPGWQERADVAGSGLDFTVWDDTGTSGVAKRFYKVILSP
jgi:subtilisin family serine protease